jgi:hypothetical protein
MSYFSGFVGKKYSQNGEEGILFELLKRMGTPEPGTFVEFGVGDGKMLSNTLLMAERGSSGIWMESNHDSYLTAKKLGDTFDGRVQTLHRLVALEGPDSLDAILDETKTPPHFDFLSIDIDSYDLEVWESLKRYQPKIVLIEINSAIPVGTNFRWRSGIDSGASFSSTVAVGKEKGYTLVAHTGNLFFVHNAYRNTVGLPQKELDDPATIFDWSWANSLGPAYLRTLGL